jgi:uncharacterized protein (UPF0335 family)
MTQLFAAQAATIIQIGTIQAFLGVAGILVAAGIAWGRLSNRVSDIEGDLIDLKTDVKKLNHDMGYVKAELKSQGEDITIIKTILMGSYRLPTKPKPGR